jgi:hypothetical protein
MFRAINRDPAAIRFRLTSLQSSLIWRGLEFIVKSHIVRRDKGLIPYSYPFRLYPPPIGFDRGAYNTEIMDQIMDIWNTLLSKGAAGGRVQMNTLQVRAAIFAVRVHIDLWRKQKHIGRRWSADVKNRHCIDEAAFKQLELKAQRVIRSLERHRKRANRHLLTLITREEYAALIIDAWKKHLRWMRLRLVYFKPLPPVIPGNKTGFQLILNKLGEMVEQGIRNEGYRPLDAEELRRMMRLFVASSRRGREGGNWNIRYLLKNANSTPAKSFLANFVLRRLNLEPLPEL